MATARSGAGVPDGAPDLQLMVCGPYPLGDDWAFSVAAALVKPASRGRLRLRTPEAAAAPDIDLGYFRDGADLPRLLEGLRLAEAAAQQRPLPEVTHGARFGPPRDVVADDAAARRGSGPRP